MSQISCKEYLAPNGFDAVQVAPVTEHASHLHRSKESFSLLGRGRRQLTSTSDQLVQACSGIEVKSSGFGSSLKACSARTEIFNNTRWLRMHLSCCACFCSHHFVNIVVACCCHTLAKKMLDIPWLHGVDKAAKSRQSKQVSSEQECVAHSVSINARKHQPSKSPKANRLPTTA